MNFPFFKQKAKKLGIVMHGGGVRAVAYAGVLKALEETGIKIDYLVGASGGAIVAGAYAAGATPEQILQHFVDFEPFSLSLESLKEGRVIDHERWVDYAKKMIGDMDISETKIKLWIQVTDATTSEVKCLDRGPLAELAIISSALPYLIGPIDYQGREFLDGDIDPGFAVSLLRENGADAVLALRTAWPNSKGLIGRLMQPYFILQKIAFRREQKLHPADMIIGELGKNYGMFETDKVKELYQQGYSVAKARMRELQTFL